MIGNRYGKWTVLQQVKIKGLTRFICRCVCGQERALQKSNLIHGRTTQCDCCRLAEQRANRKRSAFNPAR